MKLKKIVNLARNKNNHQYTFSLRIKQLKRMGLTPEELMELIVLRPKTKFYKNVN